MKLKPVNLTDVYKIDHRRQYPDKTEVVFSNLTPRKTRRSYTNKVVFFGLQYTIKEYLINLWDKEFFQRDKAEVVAEFAARMLSVVGPNDIGTKHIEDLHDLGHLPIKIMALKEGTRYNVKVPAMVIWNTDERFFWLTNYLETVISTCIWGICTSATTAFEYKKIFKKYAMKTVGDDSFVQWQGHDFSFRGMFGVEAAVLSAAGHLTSFTGTDTIPVLDFMEQYYNADSKSELIGGSVAASEHSVSSSNIGKVLSQYSHLPEIEALNMADIDYVRRMVTEIYPKGIVSVIADTFDYFNCITETAKVLKNEIMARDGKVVFRPDTGDPVKVICGEDIVSFTSLADNLDYAKYLARYVILNRVDNKTEYRGKGVDSDEIVFEFEDKYYKLTLKIIWVDVKDHNGDSYWEMAGTEELSFGKAELTPEQKGSVQCLWELFGGTVSEQGYKVLDSHVGLIYGDSITLERAEAICEGLAKKGFASTNVVFGIGSYTYAYVTRDTDGYAVKATYAKIDGQEYEIYKNPKTDDGTKKSAKGLVAVFKDENGEYILKDQATWDEVLNCEFVPVFENGKLLVDYSLQEIRERLNEFHEKA